MCVKLRFASHLGSRQQRVELLALTFASARCCVKVEVDSSVASAYRSSARSRAPSSAVTILLVPYDKAVLPRPVAAGSSGSCRADGNRSALATEIELEEQRKIEQLAQQVRSVSKSSLGSPSRLQRRATTPELRNLRVFRERRQARREARLLRLREEFEADADRCGRPLSVRSVSSRGSNTPRPLASSRLLAPEQSPQITTICRGRPTTRSRRKPLTHLASCAFPFAEPGGELKECLARLGKRAPAGNPAESRLSASPARMASTGCRNAVAGKTLSMRVVTRRTGSSAHPQQEWPQVLLAPSVVDNQENSTVAERLTSSQLARGVNRL